MKHTPFPLKIKTLDDAGRIEGVAAGYGNVDLAGDTFAPGAFKDSLATHRERGTSPAMLLHHDMQRPVGRWETFSETSDGLFVTGKLAIGVPDGDIAYALLREGALTGISVGYQYKTADAKSQAAGGLLLRKAELLEASLVAVPCNPLAQVSSVKSIRSARDIEEMLKAAGFSNRKSVAAASAAWRTLNDTADPDPIDAKIASMIAESTARLSVFHRS